MESIYLDRKLPTQPGDSLNVFGFQNSSEASASGTSFGVLASPYADFTKACFEVQGLKAEFHPTKSSGPAREVPAVSFKVHWEPAESIAYMTKDPNYGDQTQLPKSKFSGSSPSTKVVIVHDGSLQSKKLSDMLQNQFPSNDQDTVSQSTFAELDPSGKFCLLLGNVDHTAPLPSDVNFGKIKQIMMDSDGVLCVRSGAYKNCTNPNANMINGLTRTVRAETFAKIAVLDLQPVTEGTGESAFTDVQVLVVLDVLRHLRKSSLESDMEFVEDNGAVFVPRIVADRSLDLVIAGENDSQLVPFLQPWNSGSRLRLARSVADTRSGNVAFEGDPMQPLEDDEVEIAVSTTRVHAQDAKAVLAGRPGDSLTECSGVVARKGPKVHTLLAGDRVCALARSRLSSFVRCRSNLAIRVPEFLSLENAASVILPYATAYWAIVGLGNLQQGQTVLIVADGALRDATVQAAHVAGARIFVAVDSDDERKSLEHSYGINQECLLDHSRNNLFPAVSQLTHGAGVDLVAVSKPEALRGSMECIAPFGRIVEMSERRSSSMVDTVRPPRNASPSSFDFETLMTSKTDAAAITVADVARRLHAGLISPRKLVTHGIAELASVFQEIAAGGPNQTHVITPQTGQSVLVGLCIHASTFYALTLAVQASHSHARESLFDENGCYIIVGGTGGIWRSIAKWMVGKGARKVILLSRSGKMNDRITTLIEEARADGAEINVKDCDVSDKLQVRDMIEWCTIYGAVRGIILSAMVLRVSIGFMFYTAIFHLTLCAGCSI